MYYLDFYEDFGVNTKFNSLFDYLFFYLENEPLCTSRIYPDEFFQRLKNDWNIQASIKSSSKGVKNYIYFNDQQRVSELSSKKIFFDFLFKNKFFDHEVGISSESQKEPGDKRFIYKKYRGFSGKGISRIKKEECIFEEELDRIADFSIFYKNGSYIVYENKVDDNFQYKGTLFDKESLHSLSVFLNKFQIKSEKVLRFEKIVESSINFLKEKSPGFSIDYFVYKKNNEFHIHPGCEVNDRKTMGYLFYQIYKRHFFSKNKISFSIDRSLDSNKFLLSPKEESFLVQYCFPA